MGQRDPRVDAYIANAAAFAQPILRHIRDAVHAGCPDVEEAIKWSFPHFLHKGMLCSMASFNHHAVFGFWKGSLVAGGGAKDVDAMGQFGRLASIGDLPPKKTLIAYVKKAVALNEAGVKVERKPKAPAKPIRIPADVAGALEKNKAAASFFAKFPPSHKREYVAWITEAKTAETRSRRLQQAIEWIAGGKSRNWKYERA